MRYIMSLFLVLLLLSSCQTTEDVPAEPVYKLQILTPLENSRVVYPFTFSGIKSPEIDRIIIHGAGLPISVLSGESSLWSITLDSGSGIYGTNVYTISGGVDGINVLSLDYTLVVENSNENAVHPWYNYYSTAYGCAGSNLKDRLHEIIDSHNVYPYTDGGDYDVWDILKDIDEDPANDANVITIYSRQSISKSSTDGGGGGWYVWNREHVWSKSHGFPDERDHPYTDVHHLRPEIAQVNTDRYTYDFDAAAVSYSTRSGLPLTVPVSLMWDSGLRWEPADEVKGDVARMMFYMAVRYEGDALNEPDLELVDYNTPDNGTGVFGVLSRLIDWHTNDPPDTQEMQRNNLIYSNWQGNRNPFIDHPEWVTNIW